EYRTRDPQTSVDVDRENVYIGENITSRIRVDADWHTQPDQSTVVELGTADSTFKVRARVRSSTTLLHRALS
ncbi:hypothetical protein ABZ589_38690, partial [Streptomyces sp. NPDC013313]|uniref:hypothetical protein n=1 Tax=Streptomyces sp. NPDC013313 TaxID=3155603 RepID=UPI003406D9CC